MPTNYVEVDPRPDGEYFTVPDFMSHDPYNPDGYLGPVGSGIGGTAGVETPRSSSRYLTPQRIAAIGGTGAAILSRYAGGNNPPAQGRPIAVNPLTGERYIVGDDNVGYYDSQRVFRDLIRENPQLREAFGDALTGNENNPLSERLSEDGYRIRQGTGRGLRPFPTLERIDADGLGGVRSNLQELLDGMMEDFRSSDSEGPGQGMLSESVHISPGHVSAHGYSAAHATASLIDMLDKAYQIEPDANIREDVYSRLRSGATAGADDAIRQIMDSARNSGAGPNAPWVQQLASEARGKANQASTQGLTDFFDSWVQASLARRHEALSTNAGLQTGVNTFNAGETNTARRFSADAQNQASATNAQLSAQAQYWSGLLGNQRAEINNTRRRMTADDRSRLLELLMGLSQPQVVGYEQPRQRGNLFGDILGGIATIAPLL